jgi:glycosyltransferase involved in cell wall biosynthesis
MPPRKVLYVDYHTFIAGGQVILMNHFRMLDRKRWTPLLAVPDEGPFTLEARAMGLPVYVVPMKKARWRRPWQAWRAVQALRKIIRSEGVALVDANCYPANKLAAVAARLEGVPCVWHKHIIAKKRWSSTGALWRFYARFNDRVVGSSKWVVRSLLEMGIPEKKLHRIYYGIDLKGVRAFKPASAAEMKRAKFPAKGPVVGVVAMHRTHKGIDLFLEACLSVAARHKTAQFVVIGDPQNAEEAMEAAIRRLAADPRLKGRVHLLPGQRNVPAWMRRFDFLVSPSRWEVGAPLVPMEAMALGLPVLATDTSSGELIEDGKDGLIVPTGDIPALAEGMLRLLKDRKLAARLGAAGRRTVDKRHSLGRYALDEMALYDQVLAERGRAA